MSGPTQPCLLSGRVRGRRVQDGDRVGVPPFYRSHIMISGPKKTFVPVMTGIVGLLRNLPVFMGECV